MVLREYFRLLYNHIASLHEQSPATHLRPFPRAGSQQHEMVKIAFTTALRAPSMLGALLAHVEQSMKLHMTGHTML